jgi:hypothetical protein
MKTYDEAQIVKVDVENEHSIPRSILAIIFRSIKIMLRPWRKGRVLKRGKMAVIPDDGNFRALLKTRYEFNRMYGGIKVEAEVVVHGILRFAGNNPVGVGDDSVTVQLIVRPQKRPRCKLEAPSAPPQRPACPVLNSLEMN